MKKYANSNTTTNEISLDKIESVIAPINEQFKSQKKLKNPVKRSLAKLVLKKLKLLEF